MIFRERQCKIHISKKDGEGQQNTAIIARVDGLSKFWHTNLHGKKNNLEMLNFNNTLFFFPPINYRDFPYHQWKPNRFKLILQFESFFTVCGSNSIIVRRGGYILHLVRKLSFLFLPLPVTRSSDIRRILVRTWENSIEVYIDVFILVKNIVSNLF